MTNLKRLRDFVVATTRIVESEPGAEAERIALVSPLLADLVRQDDWLPEEYATAHPQYYRQYLLHADPLDRFSIVSFVWGPGQKTPVHDHQVWGLVGILRGAEISTSYTSSPGGALIAGAPERLETGAVAAVSPEIGDIHSIANAFDDRVSISIHVYGGNIGTIRRSVFDPASGVAKVFVSGYSNASIPNLWTSAEAA
jgi:predicted metal-dependent enzyme (double-stranded beta helix superfamily)